MPRPGGAAAARAARAASGEHRRPRRDTLAAVLALGEARPRGTLLVALLVASVLHGAAGVRAAITLFELAAYATGVQLWIIERLQARYDIEMIDKPPPKIEAEPPPEPEPEPPKPIVRQPNETPPPEPPAAAEAGKVLTAEPDPDEPVDLTDQGFVTGNSDHYRGGITSSAGTSKTAVRDLNAKNEGVPGGTGRAPAPAAAAGPDLSRPATPVNSNWDCPFPQEAELEQIDYALVTLVVNVDSEGRAKDVTVMRDPGHGFGRAARQCAMRMRYNVGYDRSGHARSQTTPPINVRFNR